jgi:hypothetical protein
MPIFLIIPATSEYYPDIVANDNKNIFSQSVNVRVERIGIGIFL